MTFSAEHEADRPVPFPKVALQPNVDFPDESDIQLWFAARKEALSLTGPSSRRRCAKLSSRTLSVLWHEAQALLFGLFARGADTFPFARALESLVISVQPLVRKDPEISGNLYYFSGANIQARIEQNLSRLLDELRVQAPTAESVRSDEGERPQTPKIAVPFSTAQPTSNPETAGLPQRPPLPATPTDEAAFNSLLEKLRTANRCSYSNTLLSVQEAAILGELGDKYSVRAPGGGVVLGSLPELLKQLKIAPRKARRDDHWSRLLAAVRSL